MGLLLLAAGCAAPTEPVEHPGDYVPDFTEAHPSLDRVALTTEVDPVTFGPAGPDLRSFPRDTRRIFLCFRVRNAPLQSLLQVTWLRQGSEDPLSTTETPVSGDSWMAAEHAADQPFRPGPHLVRIELDGEVLGEVEFAIDGAVEEDVAPGAAAVSGFRFVRSLTRRGRPRGRAVTSLPVKTRQIHCAFTLAAPPDPVQVAVAWSHEGEPMSQTRLGPVSGRQSLTATLAAVADLPEGRYRADVLVDGEAVHRAEVVVGEGRAPASASGAVSGLVLTTRVHPRTRQPTAPPLAVLRGDESTLYLSLRYSGMRRGDRVTVRWIQDSHPDEPMAENDFDVTGSGTLAASFEPDGLLPPGEYHVDVVEGERVLGSLAFTVDPTAAP